MLRLNRSQWIISLILVCLLAAVMLPGQASAQGAPATVQGSIRDGETQGVLDYANILLKGTSRGTMSLGGGAYYFRGLAPGTYTIKVLYLGYAPVEKTVTVSAGQSIDLDFVLETVIVETLKAFDVEGAEYMVDVTTSRQEHVISSETFENYAIDSVEEALSRQAGVVYRNGQLFVRGGRSGEVSMQVDGVRVDNPLGGGSMQMSTLSVENMALATGGLDAKYGDALSGVVNITTKEGGEKFAGGLIWTTDDFGRGDKTYTNFDRLEYGFGGPTPVKGLTYYLSGDLTFSDGENTLVADRPETKVKLGNTTLFKFRGRQSNAAKGSLKLAYTVNPDMKVTAEYSYSVSAQQGYSPNWSVKGYTQRLVYLPELSISPNHNFWYVTGRSIPVYYGPWYDRMLSTARQAIVVDARNASELRRPEPILEVRSAVDNTIKTVIAHAVFDGARFPYSSYSTVEQDSSYTGFNSANNSATFRNLSQVGKIVWRHNLSESTFYNLRLGIVAFDSGMDVDGQEPWEYNHGGISSPGVFAGQVRIYQGGNDYYTDPLSSYYVTTSDQNGYNETYSRSYSLGFELVSSEWEGHLVETGARITYNDLQRSVLVAPAVMRQDRFTDEWSQGGASNLFHTYNPEASWYLQDRWEYEGMVVNYGIRWDMFSPGTAGVVTIDNEAVDQNVTKYKTAFQPRLGFAFPITERDGFSFHYGRFVQFPDRDDLFASQDPVGATGILGNPNLEPKTTVQYSAGIVHQFNDYIAGQFSLYSKDIFDLISSAQVVDETTGNPLTRKVNKAYASARGIELSLRKRYSDHYNFEASYTYSFADGVASDTAFGANPEGLAFLPNQEMPLNWDQRHTLNLSLNLSDPGIWSSSFTISYGSGLPWTPNDRFARKQDPLLENSERLPASYNMTIQLTRHINFYGKNLFIKLVGRNLLNQDDIVAPGGFGFGPGMVNGAGYGGRSYVTETGKYGAALLHDENGDSDDEYIPIIDPRTFGPHRLFRLGVGINF